MGAVLSIGLFLAAVAMAAQFGLRVLIRYALGDRELRVRFVGLTVVRVPYDTIEEVAMVRFWDILLPRTRAAFTGSVVVVGGQAVNFWAEFYAPRVPAIEREAPFTSKDIDFCGDVRAVRICAERLAGTSRVAAMDDVTPNTGVVTSTTPA